MKNLNHFLRNAGELVPFPGRKLKPRQKQLLKVGCVTLAITLTLGAIPFLKSHAVEGDDVVSNSTHVSHSNSVTKDNPVSEGEPSLILGDTVEQKITFDSGSIQVCNGKLTITVFLP